MRGLRTLLTTVLVVVGAIAPLLIAGLVLTRVDGSQVADGPTETSSLATVWLVAIALAGSWAIAWHTCGALRALRTPQLSRTETGLARRLAISAAQASLFGLSAGPSRRPQPSTSDAFAKWAQPVQAPQAVQTAPGRRTAPRQPVNHRPELVNPPASTPAPVGQGYTGPTAVHLVGRGDTWWSLAADRLGGGERWREVLALNLGASQDDGVVIDDRTRLRSGYRIVVPANDQPDESGTSEKPGRGSRPGSSENREKKS